MKTLVLSLILLCLASCFSGTIRWSATVPDSPAPPPTEGAGSEDVDFNNGEAVLTSFGETEDAEALAVAIYPPGDANENKILVAGSAEFMGRPVFALARYNTDGSLDETFGVGGKVTTAMGTATASIAAISIASGNVHVVGSTTGVSRRRLTIERYNSVGTAIGFESVGPFHLELSGRDIRAHGIFVDTSNIMAVGSSSSGGSLDLTNLLARVLFSGLADTTFSAPDGYTELTPPDYGEAFAVVHTASGKYFTAGGTTLTATNRRTPTLVKYTNDGIIEGVTAATGSENGQNLALIDRGNIGFIGIGEAWQNIEQRRINIIRYTPTGAIASTTFNGGFTEIAIGTDATARSGQLTADDKLVVAGTATSGGKDFFAIARLLNTGEIDAAFGTAGRVTYAVGDGSAQGNAMVLDQAGRAVIVGTALQGGHTRFAVLRVIQ